MLDWIMFSLAAITLSMIWVITPSIDRPLLVQAAFLALAVASINLGII